MARSKIFIKNIEMDTETNYDFFRNAKFIVKNYTHQEFKAFLILEPYTVELEIILFRLMLKFIDTENYEFCTHIKWWVNKHTKL